MDKLFESENPNNSIFIVPTEEGADYEDQWNGSIGDATQKHIAELNDPSRQVWEELIHMRDGNIFRVNSNVEQYDKDPFNMYGEDIPEYLENYKKKGVDSSELAVVEEILQEEAKRREKSIDIMDVAEPIPYGEWEMFPQMWESIDIPSTPKDKLTYCGNSRQIFYDFFPEGHPNAPYINNILQRVNYTLNTENLDKYLNWLKRDIENHMISNVIKEYVGVELLQLVANIQNNIDQTNEWINIALHSIDRAWFKEYKQQVARKSFKNPLVNLFYTQLSDWRERFKAGENVYSEIKSFGYSLYSDKELQSQMTRALWQKYHSIKKEFAPSVIIQNTDINRCSLNKLANVLNCSQEQAKTIWFARPFENFNQVFEKNFLNKKNFFKKEKAKQVIDWLENCTNECIATKTYNTFYQINNRLIRGEKENTLRLEKDDWNLIWTYYRLCKQQISEAIRS